MKVGDAATITFAQCFKRCSASSTHPLINAQVMSEESAAQRAPELAQGCRAKKRVCDSKSYILFTMSHVELHMLLPKYLQNHDHH